MTVNTSQNTIGSNWFQVTDGTQTKTIQVLGGAVVILVDADEQPPLGTRGHTVSGYMTITPPTKAWISTNTNYTAQVVIT